MGRQQFYRGDPSLKQYYLINDFTGGINNTSVDERTETNEFRELLNVELSKKGMLQNRKGWGQLSLLNQLIDAKDLHLPYYDETEETPLATNNYALIKIVKNDGNILKVLKDYQERGLPLIEFNNLDLPYHLEILIIYEDVEGIKLGLLTLAKDTTADDFVEIATITGGQFNGNKSLNNIETVEYTDFIYFSLSQLQTGLIGFGEYNITEKTFRTIRDEDVPNTFVYHPSAYEVSKIGFNVLSNTPLTDITEQQGFLSVQGLFLTTYQLNAGALVDTQTPILNIPQDGKFTLNIIYTGADVQLQDFTLEFYVMGTDNVVGSETYGLPKEFPLEYIIDASKMEQTAGVARFAVSVQTKNNPQIYIRIKLLSGLVLADLPVPTTQFTSTTNMVNFYNPATNTYFAVPDGTSLFKIWKKTATAYAYEEQLSIAYSGTNYSPIYNDANLTNTKKWKTSDLTNFNATVDRSTYQTSTFAEYDAMTISNVPVDAISRNVGHVLRVQKTRLVTTTSSSTTYAWVAVGGTSFNTAVDITTNGASCTTFNNLTSSNVSSSIGAPSGYSNGTVVRVTSRTFELDGEGNIITGTIASCGFKYFMAVHTTTTSTSTTYEFASPTATKYYEVESVIVGVSGAIVTYNATDDKLYYRSGATKTDLTSIYGSVADLANITVRIPRLGEVILAVSGSPAVGTSYYKYNGGTAKTIDDFTQVTFVDASDTVEYIDIYPIGKNENAKPVEQLDTTGFRILEISSRLVLYKDNVVWFSDLYQFDYVPNYNYVILPLTPDDEITNISYFKGSYMIFTKERIYKMSGTFGGQDFQIQIVSDAIGCISPYSVKPFNNTLVFMTTDGLYRIKQNYYLGGLENVEKIDKQIGDIVPTNVDVYASLHNEQYMLFYKYNNVAFVNAPFNVVKMYYNLQAPQGYPFVRDKNAVQPTIIAQFGDELISVRNGLFYMYDIGYTDFLPDEELTTDEFKDYLYQVRIRTSNLFFNYPTHDKKFKSILVKTNCDAIVPLYFNIYIDNRLAFSSQNFVVTREGEGSLTYNAVDIASMELQPDDELSIDLTGVTIGNTGQLGDLDLGIDKLGDTSTQTHKIILAGKGKNITVEIRQKLDEYFGIQDIGYIYKMGKAREDR
jgi:hypothetical protein